MDPPAIMNSHGGGYRSSGNAYNLAEIWPFNFGQFNDTNREDDDDDAMVVDHRKRSQDDDDSALAVSTTTAPNGKSDSDSKRLKLSKSRDENLVSKVEREANSGKQVEQSTKANEPPKQDYIHVRARRGQATDSHSLAERAGRSSLTALNSSIRSVIEKTSPNEQARREKISERMKILQDLVPGCNKVIGKALVLDEIINYIQSLQRQVEFLSMKLEAVNSRANPSIEGFPSKDFLSMKLEAVNSRANPSIEGFPSKDFGQQTFDIAGVSFGSQAPREFSRGSSPEWLHMQIGGNFERST